VRESKRERKKEIEKEIEKEREKERERGKERERESSYLKKNPPPGGFEPKARSSVGKSNTIYLQAHFFR
jgi:hypothetical protein